jgi:uncharacterized protein
MAMKIKSMVNAYNIDAISIGNGTASRETEFLSKNCFDRAVQVLSFQRRVLRYILHQKSLVRIPNYDVTVRGSIGRRLMILC